MLLKSNGHLGSVSKCFALLTICFAATAFAEDYASYYDVAPFAGDEQAADDDQTVSVETTFASANSAQAPTCGCNTAGNSGCDCQCGGCAGGCDTCCGCGCAKKKKKKNPCATSHKPLFYNNDFSYLCKPDYCGCCLGDSLKRMCVGCNGALDIGGQWRLRYHHEAGMKGPQRFLTETDDFLLNRLRLYANYEVNDWLRFYVEGIYADSYGENLPFRPIDVNNGDFLNLFIDVKVAPSMTVRAGRQELLYGAQRLVSPLDWANTRRTFEGIKLLWRPNADWDVDAFFTNLVPPRPYALDRADYDLNFYGLWATYKGLCSGTLDLYHLGYENQLPVPAGAFALQTTGARYKGEKNDWLWELQGGYQWGDAAGIGTGDQSAGFVTGGVGRKLEGNWDPTIWIYYDYASRDYNQLFPLAHKYLGFIDAVQRSNVEAPNVLLTAKPHEKVTLLLWYYYFLAASPANVLSIGGTPLQNPAVRDFGHEIDFLVKYQFKPRSDIIVGYSHFFRGSRLVDPAIPGYNLRDADFAYVQWTLNF